MRGGGAFDDCLECDRPTPGGGLCRECRDELNDDDQDDDEDS